MRVKEYLSVRGIGFRSVNVLEDAAGREELAALGARSVPVVARDGRFVFAQMLQDVVEFLALPDDTGPTLSPAELASRFDAILAVAVRLSGQMPDRFLENQLPNRPRSWRVLLHHVFQIADSFLDCRAMDRPLRYEDLVAPPPEEMRSAAAIAVHGAAVRQRFAAWWAGAAAADFGRRVEGYFGHTSLHEMLERTVWHATQHVRQVDTLLRQVGVAPAAALTPALLAGLPLPQKVWDE
ncbi:MAG: glutaredoxin [Alphaproteobacteria bacterium]|nr:glutaredoxin [Alphaproteobacteria bacterium]